MAQFVANTSFQLFPSQTKSELDAEDRACNFIDNIVYGTYDDQGDIVLTSPTFDFKDWKNTQQYQNLRLPVEQVIGLALSLLLVISLSAMAVYTRRSMRRHNSVDTPWRPRKSKASATPDISRSPSGITMVRSQSGNAPLI